MTAGKGVVYYELLLAIMSTLVVFNFGLIFKKIRNIESLFLITLIQRLLLAR